MKQKFRNQSMVWLTIALCCQIAVGLASAADYYVAINGNDAWSGQVPQPNSTGTDGPFANIERAKQQVRTRIAAGLDHDLHISVRQGIYNLSATLSFTAEDSGSENFGIYYEAYSGESPTISGGIRITNWTAGAGGVWSAPVQGVDWFRQMTVEGERAIRARFPDTGQWATIQSMSDLKHVTLSQNPGDNLAGKDSELVGKVIWGIVRARVTSSSSNQVVTETELGQVGQSNLQLAAGKETFLEHALQFLNQPGEWYYDRGAKLLYYMPPIGYNPNNMRCVIPRLERLIEIRGTAASPVRNLHFMGLRFEDTTWDIPQTGYAEIQDAMYSVAAPDPVLALPVAVSVQYSRLCSFEKCAMAHTGANGFGIGAGARRIRILKCDLKDIGGNGIVVGWSPEWTSLDWTRHSDAPSGIEIAHNTLVQCAQVQMGAVGIHELFSRDCSIHHNLTREMPYSGIALNFNWGPTETAQLRNWVGFNHIHNCMLQLNDGGGLYTLGNQRGGVLRNNLIHDINHENGIYNDQGSSNLLIEDNVVYRAGAYGLVHHRGRDNIIQNNIFAFNAYADTKWKTILRLPENDTDFSFTFTRNLVYNQNRRELFDGSWSNERYSIDRNLYWDTTQNSLTFDGGILASWRARGHDQNSVVADPKFSNPALGDFSVPANSPVHSIGFNPIDLTGVGPQQNATPSNHLRATQETVQRIAGSASADFLGVAVGDFNGDGVRDLACSSRASADVPLNSIHIYNLNSSGTILAEEVVNLNFGLLEGPSRLMAADFNDDGRDDLMYINTQKTGWLARDITPIGSGRSPWYALETMNTVGYFGSSLPFKWDGRWFQLLGAQSANLLGWSDNTYNWNLMQIHSGGTNQSMLLVGAGDVNGDGLPEAAYFHASGELGLHAFKGGDPFIASNWGGQTSGSPKWDLLFSPSNPAPFDGVTFPQGVTGGPTAPFANLPGAPGIVIGDLSGDGRPEVMGALRRTGSNESYLLAWQRTNATFPGSTSVPGQYEWELIDRPTGCWITCISLYDYNHDTKPDLIAGTSDGRILAYHRTTKGFRAGNSMALRDYTFKTIYAPANALKAPAIHDLTVDDVNHDSFPEIAFVTGGVLNASPQPGLHVFVPNDDNGVETESARAYVSLNQ